MYDLIQVGMHTFYIDCPAKIGVYRMAGGRVLLIDSGNDKEAGKKILKILDKNNWKIDAIINTHSNTDHIGGNRFLAEKTGCKIYSTKLESAFCAFPVLEPSFLYGGFPCKQLRNKFLLAEPSDVWDITELMLPQGMEVFPLKGHFLDMIGIKTPDNVYFMADCVSGESIIEKYHISFIYDVCGYLKTLDMVENLSGRLFIPAHAEPVESMKQFAIVNREKVFEIIDGIKRICETPSTFEAVLKALFDRYNLAMDFNQYVLAGSTVRSYLSYMLDNRIIDALFQNNNLLWSTVV